MKLTLYKRDARMSCVLLAFLYSREAHVVTALHHSVLDSCSLTSNVCDHEVPQ